METDRYLSTLKLLTSPWVRRMTVICINEDVTSSVQRAYNVANNFIDRICCVPIHNRDEYEYFKKDFTCA